MRIQSLSSLILASLLVAASALPAQVAASSILYVGTYRGPESKGIYAWRFDGNTGKAQALGLAAETPNPSFLALHPGGKFLYAVQEVGEYKGQRGGALSAFAIDGASGHLKPLNEVPTGGADPCYVAVDASGREALVANYSGGSVAVLPIGPDGSLGAASSFVQFSGVGVNPTRQEAPHAHSINLSPDGRFAIAADLGLDKLMVFRFQAGGLKPAAVPFARTAPGAGPRHLAFQPDGKFVYVLNELACTVTTYAFDPKAGTLLELGSASTLPPDFKGVNTCAEIRVHPGGRFLYASNRGHDSISVYALDGRGGLKLLQHAATGGKNPRNFVLDPSGRYLLAANQASNNVVVFRVDPQTGCLSPTGEQLQVGSPVCLRFLIPK